MARVEKKVEEVKCKKCGSGQVYRRLTTNELVCRLCGNIEKCDKKEDEKDG